MRFAYTAGLAALAVVAAAALAPSTARAACADLNNNGSVTSADGQILAQCLSNCSLHAPPCVPADCPTVSPGPLCGDGTLNCADTFGDGDTNDVASLTADSAALTLSLAGLEPLYDLCHGPGPDIACPGGNVTIGDPTFVMATPHLTTSQTWPAGCTVTVAGTLFVETPPGGPTTVLRIEPGVVVKGLFGSPNTNPSAVIFLANNNDPNPANYRHSKIDAQGTPSQPIVFTSSRAAGVRGNGDWGGLAFNGLSTVNGPGCKFQAEGIPTAFGGCQAGSSSGIATFVRVEYAGIGFSANNELNVFTMNGIGSQTQFNHIQAHNGLDDCFEWFGGTIKMDHLVASACADDAFDWQLGYTGILQYGLYVQNGTETDSGQSDSRGIEADNSEFGLNNLPRSDPDFCNITLIGGRNQAGANQGTDAGVMLRRGTSGQMANMIVTTFGDNGVELRDNITSRNACVDANADRIPESLTGNLVIRNTIFYDNGGLATTQVGYLPAGTAHEQPQNSGSAGNLDGNGTECDGAACVDEPLEFDDTTPCNCDAESWYQLLPNVTACGTNATNPNLSDQYPADDAAENAACTGVGVPSLCCSGVGTGTCKQLYDARSTPTGTAIPVFDCSTLNPLLDDNTTANYLGAFKPTAPCTVGGAAASCDWTSKPWISYSIQ